MDVEFVSLLKVPMVTTESGLQYKDIKVGQGPSPPVGYQVCKSFWFVRTSFHCNLEKNGIFLSRVFMGLLIVLVD